MGQFRVTVVATGNHGCQRDKLGTDELTHCDDPYCTDCITRDYIAKLKSFGAGLISAHIHHWDYDANPRSDGYASDVVDNLLSERRLGRFH